MAEEFVLESLVVEMKGDDSGYRNMLQDAQKETQRAAQQLGTALGPSVKAVGEDMGRAGAKTREASGAVSGFSAALSSIPFGAIAAGAASLFGSFVAGIKSLERANIEARKLGVSLNELRTATVFGGAASAGAVASALSSVTGRITSAKLGDVGARQDLSGLAEASGAGRQAQSFKDVADQLSRIQSPAERAARAYQLMGSAATELTDALSKPGGIKEAENFARRAGLLVSDADVKNAQVVAQSIRDLQTLWAGFQNQIITGLAPFARALADSFDPKNLNISWIKDAIMEVAKGVLYVGAFFVEASRNSVLFWKGMEVGLKVVQAGFLQLKAVALDAMNEISKAFVKTINDTIVGYFEKLGKVEGRKAGPVNQFLQWLGSGAGKAFKIDVDAENFGKSFEKAAKDAREQSKEIAKSATVDFEKLFKDVKATEAGKWVDNLMEKVKKFADDAGKGTDKLNEGQMKMVERMVKDFDTLRASASGPLNGFVTDIRRLWNLRGDRNVIGSGDARRRGLGENFIVDRDPFSALPKSFREMRDNPLWEGLFFGTGGAARKAAGPDLLKGTTLEQITAARTLDRLLADTRFNPMPQLTSAAGYRTQEAASAEAQYRIQGERLDVQEQIKQALELAVEQRKQQIEIGNRVLKAVESMRGSPLFKGLIDILG